MGKPFLTSARETYEPPYAEIIEFAVEGGFAGSGEETVLYNDEDGTELSGRNEVTDSWY